jgi:hypothetical protein
MSKEFDVDLTQIKESNATLRATIEAESRSKHTTRPKIAWGAFQVVAFTSVVPVTIWAYAVIADKVKMVMAVMDGGSFILMMTAPLATLLLAYFGILQQEHKNRLNAATGNKSSGMIGTIAGLFKK